MINIYFLFLKKRHDRGLTPGPESEPGAGEDPEDFDYLENECLGGKTTNMNHIWEISGIVD